MKHVVAAHDEHEKQKVTGEHVGKETNCQRERTNDEVGRDFKWREDHVDPFWNAWYKRNVLEVLAKAMLADTYIVVDHVGKNHESNRETETRHRGELHEGHNSENVVHDDEGKEGEEEGYEFHKFVTDDVFAEVFLNE